ncbi:hypothetical protein, partial [Roseibium algae]
RIADLGFYAGWSLVEVQVGAPNPISDTNSALMSALVGQSTAILLDGTSPPLHGLNGSGLLDLSGPEATAAYLRFFCSYVHGKEGPFLVVETVEDLALRGDVIAKVRHDLSDLILPPKQVPPPTAGGSGEAPPDALFYTATLLYADHLFKVRFQISANGMVDMLEDDPLAEDVPITPRLFKGNWRSWVPLKINE